MLSGIGRRWSVIHFSRVALASLAWGDSPASNTAIIDIASSFPEIEVQSSIISHGDSLSADLICPARPAMLFYVEVTLLICISRVELQSHADKIALQFIEVLLEAGIILAE